MSVTSAAFFDLDRTLLTINSASAWIRYERRHGRVSRRVLVEGLVWLTGYELGVVAMERALARAVRTLEGLPEREMAERVGQWYRAEIAPHVAEKAREALALHRARGEALVLLTSSSPYISRPVVEELGMDDYLCSRFEVVEGVFTGKPVLPFCFGEGKVKLASAWAAERGILLERCTFYTDSHSDVPMLEVVGYPVVVNPDMRLRRLAKKRGWPQHQWARRG
ncbi:MAG: HAD family hydrolase [Myxococcota bacterium]